MGDKPTSKKLYQRKGWKGYVYSYKNYVENGSYDNIKWGKGTKKPKLVKSDDFKTIIKF